ncbi:MAG: hypothetical protein ACXU8S_06700 [Phenylobacterium sp.]
MLSVNPAVGLTLALALGLTWAAGPALAQEAIQTAGGATPHVDAAAAAATQASDDAGARQTLDAAAAKADGKAPPPGSCATAKPDSKPHGEVWAGAGTRGYREAGGVVTQPLGSCGTLTLGIAHTQFGDGARPGRAR